MTIDHLLSLTESKTLEFKENSLGTKNIIKTMVAFSNTAGGTLIIGVRDQDKALIGVADPIQEVEKITNLINDCITPKIVPNIEIFTYRDKNLISVQIYPGPDKPYQTKGHLGNGIYYRVGPTNREADTTMVEELKRSVTNKYFDELPVLDLNPEAIDLHVASGFFARFRELTPKNLETLGVIVDRHGKKFPSKGGVILFSPHREQFFPDCWMQAGRFAGTTKAELIDALDIHDYPIHTIERAMDFVKKHAFFSYQIGDNLQRTEQWSVPLPAVREAIINAFAHCDYSQTGAPLRLSIFDDRLEIENPGLLPFGLTVEEIIDGVSKIRNRVIVRVLHELKYIERWGQGITRIIRSCQEAGLPPPEFKEIANRFRVTIYTKAQVTPQIDDVDQRILHNLDESDGLSTMEVSKRLGLSPRATRTRLKNLMDIGLIYEISTGPYDPHKRYRARPR